MDVKEINRRTIAEFRAGGDIDGMRRDRLILLTTIGRRTGVPYTTPLMFHHDGDRLLIVASNIGAPKHPDWFANLRKDPHVTVEVGEETYPALAVPLSGDDRARTWAMLKNTYPFFAEHEMKTSRVIPVVALTRA
ncbi:nitroreductase family deazaflavin-dependent oxidoreductase [Nocardia araoensis]|uniref:nitroreductase family deazaflavin-dependent oxidoreductase n=1 Tax=Nocardia araoensis TaxID=228600 RepID=UPI0002FD23C6|nr:nitroreductase family deazaflavin-dependent oxidoreductase [Nocardia araoensis]